MQESFGNSLYDPIKTSANYIDMTGCIQSCVWDYIANVFFGGDMHRVLYTDATTAFRNRLLQLGKGIDEDENKFIVDTQLPFASFALSGAPEMTKVRSTSVQRGYYDPTCNQYIHFWNQEQKVKVQIYYSTIKDATAGYALAMAESHSNSSMKYQEEVYWRGKVLGIPVFITVDKVTAGQDSFKNSEFLKTNSLFPVVLDLKIETAQLIFNRGVNAIQLPYKWRITGRPDAWKDGDKLFYARKSVLRFASYYKNVHMDPPEDISGSLIDTARAFYRMQELDPETIRQVATIFPNPRVCDMIKGTFSAASKIAFSKLKYNESKTVVHDNGLVTAYIDLRIHPNSFDFWKKCKVIVPGHPDVSLKTCKDTKVEIAGLYPNSTYTVYFVTEDINGNSDTIPLQFTTPIWEKETDAVMDGTPDSINNRVNKEPTEIPLNGIMNLDDDWTGYEL